MYYKTKKQKFLQLLLFYGRWIRITKRINKNTIRHSWRNQPSPRSLYKSSYNRPSFFCFEFFFFPHMIENSVDDDLTLEYNSYEFCSRANVVEEPRGEDSSPLRPTLILGKGVGV
jgi:hypothetical protein